MPFIQRCLEPINVGRVEVERGIKNELECVTNHTLSNIILQLSSLSKHAEDMFTELSIEVKTFTDRTQHLLGRIDHLREKVTRLDAAAEKKGSIQGLHLKKPFKSSTIYNQQVVARSTIPRCILEAYSQCDPTPDLNKLNPYRNDGRNSLKFYTDPGYFFELWFQHIQTDVETKKAKFEYWGKKKLRSVSNQEKKPPRVKTKAQRFEEMKDGVEFIHYANPTEIQTAAININKQPRSKSLIENQRKQEDVPDDQTGTCLPRGHQCPHDVSNHTNNGNYRQENDVEISAHQITSIPLSQVSSQPNMTGKGHSGSTATSGFRKPPAKHFLRIDKTSHRRPTRDNLPSPPPPPPPPPQPPLPPLSPDVDYALSPERILTKPAPPQAPPPPSINTNVVRTNTFNNKNSIDQTSSSVLLSVKRKSTRRTSILVCNRSHLLEEIRKGIHILKRKLSEKEIFKKSSPDGSFDVHSIMSRAFEIRRKMIYVEGSDEEDEEVDSWD